MRTLLHFLVIKGNDSPDNLSRERERETDRQTDIQRRREKQRTGNQMDKQTETEKEVETERMGQRLYIYRALKSTTVRALPNCCSPISQIPREYYKVSSI